uniref:Major facilitator superfamily (MFS) profile domain-containing protein n=1 Tax=Magallana gigas TaxID=29159 RepID=K1PHT5_MAGGI
MDSLDTQRSGKLYTEEEEHTTADDEDIIREDNTLLSKPRVLLLNLSWFGLSLMFLLLSVEVVPAQIRSLVGEAEKGRWLGGMVAVGAVLNGTFNFSELNIGLIGMALSSSKLYLPRRDSGYKNGTEGMCHSDLEAQRCLPYANKTIKNSHETTILRGSQPGTILVPEKKVEVVEEKDTSSGSLGLYIFFYLIVTVSFAMITVPYNALIADKSHYSQRGFNSGVMGCMILLGNVSGAAVGIGLSEMGVLGAYGTAIAVVMVSVCVTVFTTTEKPGKQNLEPIGCVQIFCGFWEPFKEHDFRWVFFTRFLMQQGVSTVTGFLEYWLSDMIELPDCWNAGRGVAIMLLPMLFAAAISSIIFGILSDRFNRRKPIVIVAGPSAYYIAVIVAFFFGIGFGSFQSVDFALVMDILPEEKDKAKDIAVWHLALILPNALATPVGGLILDYFESVNCRIGLGYIILFVVTTVYFLLSGIFVTRIRQAK